jgi:hypothetical protein
LAPSAGKGFELVERADGGFDVRTPAAAVPVALLSAPMVAESVWVTVEDPQAQGKTKRVLMDGLAAQGMVSMRAARQGDGSYLVSVEIDEEWLRSEKRVFPIKLDPTVTTAVDLQDGYWRMGCSSPGCTPETTSNQLVASKDGSGGYANGTWEQTAGMVFSLAEIPAGATVSSTQLSVYQTGCFVGSDTGSCGYWYPENGIGQSGTVSVKAFTGAWGGDTPTGSLSVGSTVLASRGFSMWWGADQPSQWKTFTGSNLTSQVQDVVTGAATNFGLQLSLSPAYYGWGPIFASSEYSDPS